MKYFFILLLLCSISNASAQTVLNVHTASGEIVSYSFSDKPQVSYTDASIVIKTTKVQVEYPIYKLKKFTFSTLADKVDELIVKSSNTNDIHIYSTNGNIVKTIKTKEKHKTIDTSELPRGTYIVKNGSITYKIYKK